MLAAFLLPLATALVGMRINHRLFGSWIDSNLGRLESFACGLATGTLVLTQLALAMTLLAIPVRPLTWLLLCWTVYEIFRSRSAIGGALREYWRQRQSARWIVLLLPLTALLVSVFWLGGLEGLREFDAIGSWALKAKIFYHAPGRELVKHIRSPDLRYAHFEYPHLVPGMYLLTYSMLGEVNEFLIKLWPAWMLLAFCVAVLSRCGWPRRAPVAPAALVTAVAFLPMTQEFVRTEGATIPLMFYCSLAMMQLTEAIAREDLHRLALGFLMMFGAAMTKFEGALVFIFFAVAVLAVLRVRDLIRSKRLWTVTGVCCGLCIPYLAYRSLKPLKNIDNTWLRDGLARPGDVAAVYPKALWVSLSRRFLNDSFADWTVLDPMTVEWSGRWQGLLSFIDIPTMGLAWIAVALTIVCFVRIPYARKAVTSLLLTVAAFYLFHALIRACNSFKLGGMHNILACSIGIRDGRHFFPFLVGWTATVSTLLMRARSQDSPRADKGIEKGSAIRRREHNRPIDVLFVNPPSPDGFVYIRDINRHGRSSWERIIWPQTSLAYLAAVAEKCGLSVDIVDCIAEGVTWPAYEKILEQTAPRYCFNNVISVTYSNDLKALRRAKEISNATTVGMGPHLTSEPRAALLDSPGLDFIILREAEETMRELLDVLESGPDLTETSLEDVSGIAFVPGRHFQGAPDEPILTDERPFIEDLDSLPRPRHDLLPLGRYWSPFLGNYTFVEASRGCKYKCVFCRQAVMWRWQFRCRSGTSIAEEALYVHSLGVDNILFHADTFTLSPRMVAELCDALIAAGAPFRWACNTHVKPLLGREELVRKMKAAGCWMIAIGIESGDDGILENIRKQITVDEAEEVVRMIHGAGIEAWGYFVLGLPGETPSTLEKSIDFAVRLPLHMAKFDIAAPYPGTEFYRYVKEYGYLKAEHYEELDQNASAVVEYPDLSRAQIRQAVRRAKRRFFLRPRILLRVMKEIRDIHMLKSILLIVRDQFRLLYGTVKRARTDATIAMSGDSPGHTDRNT